MSTGGMEILARTCRALSWREIRRVPHAHCPTAVVVGAAHRLLYLEQRTCSVEPAGLPLAVPRSCQQGKYGVPLLAFVGEGYIHTPNTLGTFHANLQSASALWEICVELSVALSSASKLPSSDYGSHFVLHGRVLRSRYRSLRNNSVDGR